MSKARLSSVVGVKILASKVRLAVVWGEGKGHSFPSPDYLSFHFARQFFFLFPPMKSLVPGYVNPSKHEFFQACLLQLPLTTFFGCISSFCSWNIWNSFIDHFSIPCLSIASWSCKSSGIFRSSLLTFCGRACSTLANSPAISCCDSTTLATRFSTWVCLSDSSPICLRHSTISWDGYSAGGNNSWTCTCKSEVLQSSKVKCTPQDSINKFIIQKLNLLVLVDFRFIMAFLHAYWVVNSHARHLQNFYLLQFAWIWCNSMQRNLIHSKIFNLTEYRDILIKYSLLITQAGMLIWIWH